MLCVAALCAIGLISAAQSPIADPHEGGYTRGLGVSCDHCHEGGDWTRSSRESFAIGLRMQRMVEGLNAGALQARGGITCYTCHRGATAPAKLPSALWQAISEEWPATATVSPRNAGRPAREFYRNLQVIGAMDAGNVRLTMSEIAASLGVNCEYCHAGDEWDSDNKPAKRTAREMLRMLVELPRYFEAVKSPTFQCYTCHQGTTEPQR